MTTWQDRAVDLKRTYSWMETARQIQREFFQDDDLQAVYDKVRSHIRRRGSSNNLLSKLRKGADIRELAAGVTEKAIREQIEDLRDKGHCIDDSGDYFKLSNVPHEDPQTHENKWNGEQIIRFGLCGDTQINSKYTQITHLHTAYEIYKSEGIETVYHTGDIDEGEQMRPGHQYECYNQGADDHAAEIIRVYPKNGIKTRFITGNHDAAFIRLAGLDIGRMVSAERPDMEYLGQSQAFIQLTPNCVMELRHPGDGTAYSLSYKTQKMIEAMSGGEKPNILAVGHYHKTEYLFYRNIHCLQTGCLQAQTPWMRGRGISAHMGFWIVEIRVEDDGTINRIRGEFIPFYKAIKDDYKAWG